MIIIVIYVFVVASTATNVKVCVDETYQNQFMKSLQKLRQNDEYTDVTLQSGDVNIPCHRNVLAAASDYFKAMFQCGLKESTSNTVQLTMEPEILRNVVDYIYTGEFELTVDNVENLVKSADVLSLERLKTTCADFMISQVDPHNCFQLCRFSTLYGLDQLQKVTRQFICAEFKTVAFDVEFKELTSSELIEFLKDDAVNVANEDVVFEAVIGWIRHDLDKRRSSFEEIMKYVRLPFCSNSCLWEVKDIYDLLTPKCFEYLHEAMAFQKDVAHRERISSGRTLPRANYRTKPCLLVVGGVTTAASGDIDSKRCEYYKEDTTCWESLTDLPWSLGSFYNVCGVDEGLILTGGFSENALEQCWLYDVVTKKWESMPPLITARCHHRSVSLSGGVYVVGGRGIGDVLASVECLDLRRRQWSTVADMPQAVCGAPVATFGNKLFVFGGRDAYNTPLRCTQVLDTTRGSWNTQSDTPDVCDVGAVVTLNDSIYLVGGFRRSCLKYDPASDSWTRLSRPQLAHVNAPAVVWRGSILVAGGHDPEESSSVIETYDPTTDTWTVCDIALNAKLSGHCVFTIDLSAL